MVKKIAIVNQRYGEEVNGGSEYYTKKLAEQLNKIYQVEVLTTTALDYDTWKPFYQPGVETINNVKVRRFSVQHKRKIVWFKFINKLLISFPIAWKILEPAWNYAQGPFCPDLVQYIKQEKNNYDLFIFVTYLYYTTIMGLPEVAEKAILVPTAHNEYCIYFHQYKALFEKVKKIVYLTEEEKCLVEGIFNVSKIPYVIAGTGIEIERSVEERVPGGGHQIEGSYIIYVGRVDSSKGCEVLFRYFSDYKKARSSGLRLVVVGKMMIELPEHKDILCLGYVDETVKYNVLADAVALVMPSEYESLSLSVLEAMDMEIPVIVNGACKVLRAHCEKSGAGLWYETQQEFEQCLDVVLSDVAGYNRMKKAGKNYIRENYNWENTIAAYNHLIQL